MEHIGNAWTCFVDRCCLRLWVEILHDDVHHLLFPTDLTINRCRWTCEKTSSFPPTKLERLHRSVGRAVSAESHKPNIMSLRNCYYNACPDSSFTMHSRFERRRTEDREQTRIKIVGHIRVQHLNAKTPLLLARFKALITAPDRTQLNSTGWVRLGAVIITRDSSQLNWSSCHKFCDSEYWLCVQSDHIARRDVVTF